MSNFKCCDITLAELLIILGMFAVLSLGLSNVSFDLSPKRDTTLAISVDNVEIRHQGKICEDNSNDPCSKNSTTTYEEITELKRQIADDKKDYFDAKINTQSFFLSLYGLLIIFGGGVAAFFGFNKLSDMRVEIKDEVINFAKANMKSYIETTISGPNNDDFRNQLDTISLRLEALADQVQSKELLKPQTTNRSKIGKHKKGNAFKQKIGENDE